MGGVKILNPDEISLDEYWAFVYTTAGSGDLSLGTRWKELF